MPGGSRVYKSWLISQGFIIKNGIPVSPWRKRGAKVEIYILFTKDFQGFHSSAGSDH